MNSLLQTICRVGIFMICAQMVVHFRPQASYEKYLKLLVSVMVLIQLLLPISGILFHGDSEELERKLQVFMEGLEAEMSAAESRAFETDALLEQMTLEEIRRRVEEAKADAGDGGSGNGEAGTGGPDAGERQDDSGAAGGVGDEWQRDASGMTGGVGDEWQKDASGMTGGADDTNAVRIDRIQVGEIRIRPESGFPE